MNDENTTVPFRIIGHIRSRHQYPWQLPRQGALASHHDATIELDTNIVSPESLRELSGFDRLWVVFVFHKAEKSRELVSPPGIGRRNIGVFATRSPHRVNPIGLSCVKLMGIEGNSLVISESDMMDGSPILDIKPYIPYADSFASASPGWTKERELNTWSVEIGEESKRRLQWILEFAGLDLISAIYAQLSDDPFNSRRKRVQRLENVHNTWQLSCRTWRIHFCPKPDEGVLRIINVCSGYNEQEVFDSTDKYQDKHVHRDFLHHFGK